MPWVLECCRLLLLVVYSTLIRCQLDRGSPWSVHKTAKPRVYRIHNWILLLCWQWLLLTGNVLIYTTSWTHRFCRNFCCYGYFNQTVSYLLFVWEIAGMALLFLITADPDTRCSASLCGWENLWSWLHLHVLLNSCPPIQGYIESGLFKFTYGSKDNLVDFLHVDNFCQAHIKAAETMEDPASPVVCYSTDCVLYFQSVATEKLLYSGHPCDCSEQRKCPFCSLVPRLSLSFPQTSPMWTLCAKNWMFARARSKGRERENLGTRLSFLRGSLYTALCTL